MRRSAMNLSAVGRSANPLYPLSPLVGLGFGLSTLFADIGQFRLRALHSQYPETWYFLRPSNYLLASLSTETGYLAEDLEAETGSGYRPRRDPPR